MTSRFTLLAGVAGLIWAGCSAPAEDGDIADPPTTIPPGYAGNGNGNNAVGQAGGGALPPAATAGTGGTGPAPVAQGGTGGAPVAAGGAGGAPVAAAGAGGAAGGDVPIGTGLAIIPQVDGWVPGDTNGLGIQGAFFASSDATDEAGAPTNTGSTITLDTATTPGTVCVSGNFPTIPPDPTGTEGAFLYATHWGGLLGLNLHQVLPAGGGMAQDASAWSRTTPAGTVTGFSYVVTANGGTALPHLRFTVDFVGKTAGDTFCRDNAEASTNTLFNQVIQSCWQAGGAALPAADLLTVQWSIIPSTDAATPFNFCVSNVQAIVTP